MATIACLHNQFNRAELESGIGDKVTHFKTNQVNLRNKPILFSSMV